MSAYPAEGYQRWHPFPMQREMGETKNPSRDLVNKVDFRSLWH
jgi:hypothetical protein